jgi:hypothetical protein
MRVVEHRVAVDDVQPTWRNDLNFRFETAFDIVKLGRLALLRPAPTRISGSSRGPPHVSTFLEGMIFFVGTSPR